MSELIKVRSTKDGLHAVDARELYNAFENKTDNYRKWVRESIFKNKFLKEGRDYVSTVNEKQRDDKGVFTAQIECTLTLDSAIALASKYRSKKKKEILEHLYSNKKESTTIQWVEETKEEHFFKTFIGLIKQNEIIYEDDEVITQYPVLDYRVDLALFERGFYGGDSHIQLFEYDEEYHSRPTQIKNDKKREMDIINKLKSKFEYVTLYRIPEGSEYEFIYGYLRFLEDFVYISDEWGSKFVKYSTN